VSRIGVIGYGYRIQHVIKVLLESDPEARITAITDIRNQEIAAQMAAEGGHPEEVAFYTDADDMLANESLDGVMIGTRCSMHAELAAKVLARDLPLYLEKPVATNMADLLKLRDAAIGRGERVVVSFPLRMTPIAKFAKEIVESGKIGPVEHVQAWNNVTYGQVYYQTWYRNHDETQGMFLQKATHDFDYINDLLGIRPAWISAMTSKRVFTGDHPEGLLCKDCAENVTCGFSSKYITGEMGLEWVDPAKMMCGLAPDAANEDSGSALIKYETGMHVAYTQNFFARKKAGSRGARLIGPKGTLEFDWYEDQIKVFMHDTARVETYDIPAAGSHGGGDHILAGNFAAMVRGEAESVSSLDSGLMSALMCLKAKESAETMTFQEIKWPD
jgi:predicted dehydrogenase